MLKSTWNSGSKKVACNSILLIFSTTAVAPITEDGPGEDIPLIIILTICAVGLLVLALNIILILFFIRRRKKKLEKGLPSSFPDHHHHLFYLENDEIIDWWMDRLMDGWMDDWMDGSIYRSMDVYIVG